MGVIEARPVHILAKGWRYSVAKDFQSRDGASATWAPEQPQEWGAEQSSAPLEFARTAALNADSSLLAVTQFKEVLIYDTIRLELLHVLRGRQEVGEVMQVGFHPHQPLELASNIAEPVGMTSSTISFWNLALDTSSKEAEVVSGLLPHNSFYDRRGDRILFYTSTDSRAEPLHEIFVLDMRNPP